MSHRERQDRDGQGGPVLDRLAAAFSVARDNQESGAYE